MEFRFPPGMSCLFRRHSTRIRNPPSKDVFGSRPNAFLPYQRQRAAEYHGILPLIIHSRPINIEAPEHDIIQTIHIISIRSSASPLRRTTSQLHQGYGCYMDGDPTRSETDLPSHTWMPRRPDHFLHVAFAAASITWKQIL